MSEFDSLEAAVSAASWEQEEGEAAPDHIEVVTADRSVRRVEGAELTALLREHTEQTRTSIGDSRPYLARIIVTSGQGEEAAFGWYQDMGEAERDFARLENLLGSRVTLARL